MTTKQRDVDVPEHYENVKSRHRDGTLEKVDPELQAVVDEYNRLIEAAYAPLEGTVLETVMPVAKVKLIHISQVQANDYNPNSVAHQEMNLLHTSISEDGYTQPVVSIWDPEAGPDRKGRYIIVDGFHRFTTMRRYEDIYQNSSGYLPVVVLEKDIADRIASTVRHNRARGKHSVQGMGTLVFQMLEAGENDETICKKLGLEAEELARLKHITGYSKLYKDVEYGPVILGKTQLEAKAAYKKEHPNEHVPAL